MGRTIATFNMAAQHEQQTWADFRRALRTEDRDAFDALWIAVRRHMQAGQQAARLVPFDAMLMAMLIEHQKEIVFLSERVRRLERLTLAQAGLLPEPEDEQEVKAR